MQRCSWYGQTGHLRCGRTMNSRLRDWLAMALFVVLAGYVGFSGVRLALLLWQRFGVA
ncbi:hypothetical protein LBMAG39_15900 [Cyanobium sp.]|nr:hypothetical protein LBMAG39_15900 [Cyanobium sp.]